ncbi:MAG: endonuclease/exonuclease/phosphatase family protein [Muribaculaceae bacterium]|jgi:endonuclease/exonuclease/phosphatase family metal-dependent hydrolase|nr:endonuclease/exonuclease/phosphatase family protein [Muribaculaceae bacterium]
MKKLLYILTLFVMASCTHQLTIMTYNIRDMHGMDNKVDSVRTANVIRAVKPDVVMLQEIDSMAHKQGVDVMLSLGKLTDMNHTYGSAIVYGRGTYGVGMLSREKPIKTWKVPLPGKEEKRVLLFAEFRHYIAVCTHFSLTADDRLTSVEIIRTETGKLNKPVFIGGDFNSTPQSQVVKNMAQSFTCLTDTTAFTFPANKPVRTIDYIWTTLSKTLVTSSSTVIDEPVASDHRPVVVKIKYTTHK